MKRYGPSFVLSVLLHVGLLALALITWQMTPKPIPVASVPVELVSQVPMHAQTETPVDKLAVKTPTPEPAPEEETKPTPPTPAPKLPVPVPQKEIVAPPVKTPAPKPVPVKAPETKPTPKPTPAPPKPAPVPTPAPPDKNGMKKPQPTPVKEPAKPTPAPAKAAPAKPTAPAKPVLDLDALSQIAAAPSKSRTRNPAQANTHATNGSSNYGAAPADAGMQTAIGALTQRLQKLWNPACDVPGFNTVHPDIRFVISPSGRVTQGPDWANPRNDPVWTAAANNAKSAVKRGELYEGLPAGLYNRPLVITFDGSSACGG